MITIFIEGFPVRSSPKSWDGKTKVREWGWRMIHAQADVVIAFNEGYSTKKAAVEAGKQAATGYYHVAEAEVIELTRVRGNSE